MNGLNNHECSISFKKIILEPKIFHRQNYYVIKIFPVELISPPLGSPRVITDEYGTIVEVD